MVKTKASGTDNDVHLITQTKGDNLQSSMRNVDNRIPDEDGIEQSDAPNHKPFRNFSAKFQNGVI